jgi:ABC-type microcin C transport system permease subunit YejE
MDYLEVLAAAEQDLVVLAQVLLLEVQEIPHQHHLLKETLVVAVILHMDLLMLVVVAEDLVALDKPFLVERKVDMVVPVLKY